MYVLGISEGHNATAALLKNGKIVGCVSEERFSGKKNHLGFPYQSIEYLLKKEKIQGKNLDLAVVTEIWGVPILVEPEVRKDPYLKIAAVLYAPLNLIRYFWGLIEYRLPFLHPLSRFLYEKAFRIVGERTTEKKKQFIASYLGIDENKVKAFEHHSAHAAAAYYGSPYSHQDTLVLTIDSEGDLISASVSIVKKGKWRRLSVTPSDASLGYLYSEVTKYLGMKRAEHEYKVMGLAPYAKERGVNSLYKKIQDLVFFDKKDPLRFRARFDTHYMRRYLRKGMLYQRFDYIAGAFQKLLEERMMEWVKAAVKKTGIRTLCLGGGVIMNVKANLKIAQLPEVKEIFPCPSAGDESTPIGACYLGYREYCRQNNIRPEISPLKTLYLGPSFTNEEIKSFLKKGKYFKKYQIEYFQDIEKKIAQLLSRGKIVARMAGRMEWGARALGNRSILANPSNPKIVRIINEQIKDRDFWMPFTPSILMERAKDYLVNPKKIPAPYMVIAFRSTKLARKHLSAAIHPYDFTIRPQVLEKDWNPSYYRLIKEFERLTGIGGVFNTSFNLHGRPIVLGPKEAIYAFENSGLVYLALEKFLIIKQ